MAQIDKPSLHFNTVLYTGNGSAGHGITGVGFQPDFTWIKSRNITKDHMLFDAVRGVTKALKTNQNYEEDTNANFLTAFGADGFTVGDNGKVNTNSDPLVSWNWKANGAGSSNTDGTITSTVSANTTAGFSIVKYTGNATNSTVGHGLGVTPQVVIVKNLISSGGSAEHWRVQHHKVAASKVLYLNLTNAESTNGDFQSTYPGSSTFSISSADGCNKNGEANIAYCFAEKKGFSKFGSYTGNGNADGPFVYTGFKPSFYMVKQSSASGEGWFMWDNKRSSSGGANENDRYLIANSSAADGTLGVDCDFLSNGVKTRYGSSATNSSGATYIYIAFAENPIVGSNNIPAVAR